MSGPARRVRIDLAYDGTAFAGWQCQPGQRTVQGVLEGVLGQLAGGAAVAVRGAGRTDAGVHARRQTADARLITRLCDRRLAHALSGILPADLRPRALATVPDDFDARRDAQSKTYAYRLDTSRFGDPLRARFALHHPWTLDHGRIAAALDRLPGRHDWSGFTAAKCEIDDRRRTMHVARLAAPDEHELCFVFGAEGFLTHMVRNLVGTLLWIGAGRLDVARIDELLARGDRTLAGPTAPAHGLCLEHVRYADDAGWPEPEARLPSASTGLPLRDTDPGGAAV